MTVSATVPLKDVEKWEGGNLILAPKNCMPKKIKFVFSKRLPMQLNVLLRISWIDQAPPCFFNSYGWCFSISADFCSVWQDVGLHCAKVSSQHSQYLNNLLTFPSRTHSYSPKLIEKNWVFCEYTVTDNWFRASPLRFTNIHQLFFISSPTFISWIPQSQLTLRKSSLRGYQLLPWRHLSKVNWIWSMGSFMRPSQLGRKTKKSCSWTKQNKLEWSTQPVRIMVMVVSFAYLLIL